MPWQSKAGKNTSSVDIDTPLALLPQSEKCPVAEFTIPLGIHQFPNALEIKERRHVINH
jgi:hypothetical protein